MVFAYSPHRESGGNLRALPSTNTPRSDPNSALAQLRRSLSRSPSRGPAFRLITSKSNSPSPSSPLSPSPLSPSQRGGIITVDSPTKPERPSPLGSPFLSASKKKRSSIRHPSPMRSSARPLGMQRSPAKRALADSTDNGNATPMSSRSSSGGLENDTQAGRSTVNKRDLPIFGSLPMRQDNGNSLAPHHALGRRERQHDYFNIAKSSPLKRSEGSTNLELAHLGAPAKRRSLHGASFGSDFNIFDHAAAFQQNDDGATANETVSNIETGQENLCTFTPLPQRSSSLRKTTLQHRFERPGVERAYFGIDGTQEARLPATPDAKSRSRLSHEFPVPHMNRESPFTNDNLPSASIHPAPLLRREASGPGNLLTSSRHPLARTISQSSSNSGIALDSPTHVPTRHPDFHRPRGDLSKSLPLGALRPPKQEDTQASASSSQESYFATPNNYQLAKPLPAAFMSTGLISKRNKNIDPEETGMGESLGHMPDTPCKRPTSLNSMLPEPTPEIKLPRARQARHTLHSFGTPSTPFNLHVSRAANKDTTGLSIFGSSFNDGNASRRGSFVAADIEDKLKSPLTAFRHSYGKDFKAPPTPTKQASDSSLSSVINDHSPEAILGDGLAAGEDSVMDSPRSSFKSSPIVGHQGGRSPHTPLEAMVPPDPSGLSISAHADKSAANPFEAAKLNSSFAVPATPTAPRDSFGRYSNLGSSATPMHHAVPSEIDTSITSRFDKVEPHSSGEFSQVFRVSRWPDAAPSRGLSTTPRSKKSIKTPLSDHVWAVKKAVRAYFGPRDRTRRLQEVEVLRALDPSDHTINYVDSWEYNSHLYIQTEFCEEGALDSFLERAGQSARLDDFRIWKIMLELSLGLKHIHDSGFIHLDLKPANILITFEGVLKIADFGMATRWPAEVGIEGEGDRGYIGPEILKGKFDKPADIFAFGLIMLEIAGNVRLPENGASWQRLRSGDLSDVPSLTSSSEVSSISRDESGNPITSQTIHDFRCGGRGFAAFDFGFDAPQSSAQVKQSPTRRAGELYAPPDFMLNMEHESALDKVVRWMISPEVEDRPTASDILKTEGVRWTEARRRAGATIFEGNYGPADDILHHDAEMIDV